MKKGDIVLMNCFEQHGYAAVSHLETIWFHFAGLNCKEIYKTIQEQNNLILQGNENYMIHNTMNKIVKIVMEETIMEEALISAYISRMRSEERRVGKECRR